MLDEQWMTKLFRFLQIGWALATLGIFTPLISVMPTAMHISLYIATAFSVIAMGLHVLSFYFEPRVRAMVSEALLGIILLVGAALVLWEIDTGRSSYCVSFKIADCEKEIVKVYIGATVCKSTRLIYHSSAKLIGLIHATSMILVGFLGFCKEAGDLRSEKAPLVYMM